MPEYNAMGAPYSVYLGAVGAAQWVPDKSTDEPDSATWTKIEDGDIAQNPVTVTWERVTEEEEPSINETFPRRAYLMRRGFQISFSLQDAGVSMIAGLLDNDAVTTQDVDATKPESTSFSFSEQALQFRALLLVGYGQLTSGATAFPRIIQVSQACYSSGVEVTMARNQSPMFEATFRGIRHPDGTTVSFRKMLADKTA